MIKTLCFENAFIFSVLVMLAAYILAAVTIALTTWIFVTWKKRKNYPPGPFPLPFIGNLHLLRKDIHIAMDELSKQYGDMFTLWMTDIPYIVITDITLAKKVALTKKFANRLPLYVGDKLYSRGCKDIIFGDYGEALILHKRMAHSALSMFGKGLLCFEDRIMSSVDALINTLDENKENEMFSLHDDVELACFNVMSSIVLGTSMDKEDERFQKLRNAVFYMMQSGVTLSLINFYPILRYLPNKDLKGMIKVLSERDEVLKNILDYTISTYQCGQVTNYIEALLKAKSDIEETEGQGYVSNILSRDHIEMNIFDMFLGGVETVSTTLMWALLYLMKWPETQRKCHCELDKVLGLPNERSRVVYKDKDSLPYLQAVVLETLRLASTLPFGVFHKAREDVELNGYRIQKGKKNPLSLNYRSGLLPNYTYLVSYLLPIFKEKLYL